MVLIDISGSNLLLFRYLWVNSIPVLIWFIHRCLWTLQVSVVPIYFSLDIFKLHTCIELVHPLMSMDIIDISGSNLLLFRYLWVNSIYVLSQFIHRCLWTLQISVVYPTFQESELSFFFFFVETFRFQSFKATTFFYLDVFKKSHWGLVMLNFFYNLKLTLVNLDSKLSIEILVSKSYSHENYVLN